VAGDIAGQELPTFEAVYKIGIPNITAAEMTVTLKRKDRRLLYRSQVEPKGWLGHLFNVHGSSHSSIIDRRGRYFPLLYQKQSDDESNQQRYRFDWRDAKAQVLYKGERYTLDLPKGTVDENTLQLALRRDVINSLGTDFDALYTVLSDGRLKQRRFIKRGEERIDSALGVVSAIRIERYKKGRVDQIYWLSPKHYYLPIKIVRLDGKKTKTTVQLQKITSDAERPSVE